MRTKLNKTLKLLAPALLGAAAAITGATAVTLVSLAHSTARVGDIIAFEPSAEPGPETETRLPVDRPDRPGCVLDLNTIRRTGGSLIVEARLADSGRRFLLHWAGARTSADSSDCGHSADLIADRSDMDILALAAGGYGVGRKKAPVFAGTLAN
jgi:hypothetical protein